MQDETRSTLMVRERRAISSLVLARMCFDSAHQGYDFWGHTSYLLQKLHSSEGVSKHV